MPRQNAPTALKASPTASKAGALPARRRVRAVRDRLRLLYGVPLAAPHGQPIAELVLTVLSQSTNDRNRDLAYLGLRERFPAWAQVRDAPVDELEQAIRPGGISKVKSARIKAILRAICDGENEGEGEGEGRGEGEGEGWDEGEGEGEGRGEGEGEGWDEGEGRGEVGGRAGEGAAALSLDWLAERSVPAARRYLISLPGVGRKTAACVLLFALGMRDVPVDTHVARVGTRLGLLRRGAPFEELHDTMLSLSVPGEELELHLNLLRHGRRTCHARAPECAGCALARMCPSAFSFA